LALDGAGTFFVLLDPFKQVYDYLKGVKETCEVRQQLESVLHSLDTFAHSAKKSQTSGKAMVAKVDALDPPISAQEAEDLMKSSVEFFDDFRVFLSSICDFGKECNELISGDFEGFMEKVKARKPDVHDIMTFFGRNYDPKTDSLDLTRLPALIRIYGKKGAWKESKELSEMVAEGKKKVNKLLDKAEAIRKQRPVRIMDRKLIIQYFRSFQRLAREGKRLRASNKTLKELRENAPSWYLEFAAITDDVRKALPGGSRPAFGRG
jgi:hypothetical protein